MRSVDGPKSNGQRLFEAVKKIKKQGMGIKPYPNLRPSEVMMMHSIRHFLRKQMVSIDAVDNDTGDESKKRNGVMITELSEFTQMTPSAISQTVKALEEKGYVTRTFSLSDRRAVFVSISEQGQKLIDDSEKSFLDYLDRISEALGKEDTDRLIELIEKLAAVLPTVNK